MEIESKWDITADQYAALRQAFPDGSSRYGYTFRVRWGGFSRRFVDTYYDALEGDLGRALHTLRHRARYQSNPRPPDDLESSLDAATWVLEWESIQYKSTPCRIDATWFRRETGECRLRDENGENLCVPGRPIDPAEVFAGNYPSHDGIRALGQDHPAFALDRLRPSLHVSDYRYRIEVEREGRTLFELSLDRLYTTDLVTGSRAIPSVEAELEIIADEQSAEVVRMLLDLSGRLQRDFNLRPSTHSKGRVMAPVEACQAAPAG